MISQKPTKIALVLATALFVTGCSLKPRPQTSRFHSSANSGRCSCYTCKNSACSDGSAVSSIQANGQTITYPSETIVSIEPSTPVPAPANSLVPATTKPRTPYQYPTVSEPVVSKESFDAVSPELDSNNPVNEVDADSSPSDQLLDLKSDDTGSLEGGEFKPKTVEKETATIEAPKAVEQKIEPIAEPKPVVETKPIVAEPIAEPKPVVDTKPTEPAPAIDPLDVPEPTSTFKPGETFKPRKKKTTGSSSWKSPSSFQGIDPFAAEAQKVAQAPAPVKIPDPIDIPKDDPVDSFFGRDGFKPVAKQLPQPEANDKIVLRANPVERNVIYVPPRKSVTKVVVPALRAGFKSTENGNWLRDLPSEQTPAQVNQIAAQQQYESTQSANLTQQMPQQPQALTQPQAPVRSAQIVEAAKPQTIPVVLRAIPMNERMIKGKQVEARFREHIPTPEKVEQRQLNAAMPGRLLSRSDAVPELPELTLPAATENEIDLPLAVPAVADSAPERTANAEENNVVTPPWRIK